MYPAIPATAPVLKDGAEASRCMLVPFQSKHCLCCRCLVMHATSDSSPHGSDFNQVCMRAVALAFEPQMVDSVPVEPHDRNVDIIVTARGVLRCSPKAQQGLGSETHP